MKFNSINDLPEQWRKQVDPGLSVVNSEKHQCKRDDSWKNLQKAVRKVLDIKCIPYSRIDNYRCFKCGQILNKDADGFPDFWLWAPIAGLECKTGVARLTSGQKRIKRFCEDGDIPYIVCRDTVDKLLEFLNGENQCKNQ